MKKFLVRKGFVIVLLIIIFIVLIISFSQKKEEFLSYQVKRCNLKQIVSVTGSLKPAKEISLASQVAGQIKAINFQEGDKVQKGETIVKIDDQEILTEIAQTEADINYLKENLRKLKSGASPEEKRYYQAKLAASQKSLEQAKSNLENTKAVAETTLANLYQDVYQLVLSSFASADDAINRKLDPLFENDQTNPKLSFQTGDFQAKNDVIWQRKICQEILENWQKEIEKVKEEETQENLDYLLSISEKNLKEIEKTFPLSRKCLNNSLGLSQTELAENKDLVNLGEQEILTSLANIQSKIQAINLQKKNNKKSIEAAENTYQVAKANFELAKKEFELKTSPAREEDIRAAESNLKKAQASLSYYYLKLEKTKIKAPVDGIITEIPLEVGDFVNIGQKVVGFISQGKKEIEVNVAESDIAKVKIGDQATIDFDALGPKEKFEAKVVSINPASTIISGVVYYKVKLYLKKDDPRLKPGMTANIDILTAKKENVLCLPYQFIEEKDHKKFVYLKSKQGKIVEREIEIGLEGESEVEIKKGLKEGEEVVIGD
mgnify:CR=1 FL=1